MTRKKALIILIVIVVLIVVAVYVFFAIRLAFFSPYNVPAEKQNPAIISGCQIDADCVLVPKKVASNDCCPVGCGVEVVDKAEQVRRAAYESESCFKSKSYIEVCGDIDCEPNSMTPKCVNNICQLIKEDVPVTKNPDENTTNVP